jgi:hypothetical protein
MVVLLRVTEFETLWVAPLVVDGSVTVRALSLLSAHMLVLRTSSRSIDLVGASQPLFPVGPEDVVRSGDSPLHVDGVTEIGGMRATVVTLRDDGAPKRLRFIFDHDLDDPSYLWVIEKSAGVPGAGRFEEVTIPPNGHGQSFDM